MDRIKNSYIVIANLTGLNPNVFYELGVRHSLSNRTIIITEDYSTLPSDLKEYRAIEYSPDITGVETFKSSLSQSIKEIQEDPEHADNPVQDRIGSIIKTNEESLLQEIELLKSDLWKKKGKRESSRVESTEKRVDRILKLMNVERGGIIGDPWEEVNEEDGTTKKYHIKEPEGNFTNYFTHDAEIKGSDSNATKLMSLAFTSAPLIQLSILFLVS